MSHDLIENKNIDVNLNYPTNQQTISKAEEQQIDPLSELLPTEIAALIFQFYVETATQSNEYVIGSSPRLGGPFLLASISHSWKEISISTPILWTQVSVFIRTLDDMTRSPSKVQLMLTRSQKSPISINVSISDLRDYAHFAKMNVIGPLSSILKASYHRWQRVFLTCQTQYYDWFIGNIGKAPLLEYLDLHPLQQPHRPQDHFILPHTPLLTHLKLFDAILLRVHINLTYLLTFEGRSVFMEDILIILRTAKSLLHCTLLDFGGSEDLPENAAEKLVHDSLKELYISPMENTFPHSGTTFLDILTLPALESFTYDFSYSLEQLPIDRLLALFTRSHCSLTQLSILNLRSSTYKIDNDLISLLKNLPLLKSVMIGASNYNAFTFSNTFMHHLRHSNQNFLPSLEVFRFSGFKAFDWMPFTCAIELLIASARSRQRPIQLLEFILHSYPYQTIYIDEDATSRLYDIVRDTGLLRIIHANTSLDLVHASMEHHGIPLHQ